MRTLWSWKCQCKGVIVKGNIDSNVSASTAASVVNGQNAAARYNSDPGPLSFMDSMIAATQTAQDAAQPVTLQKPGTAGNTDGKTTHRTKSSGDEKTATDGSDSSSTGTAADSQQLILPAQDQLAMMIPVPVQLPQATVTANSDSTAKSDSDSTLGVSVAAIDSSAAATFGAIGLTGSDSASGKSGLSQDSGDALPAGSLLAARGFAASDTAAAQGNLTTGSVQSASEEADQTTASAAKAAVNAGIVPSDASIVASQAGAAQAASAVSLPAGQAGTQVQQDTTDNVQAPSNVAAISGADLNSIQSAVRDALRQSAQPTIVSQPATPTLHQGAGAPSQTASIANSKVQTSGTRTSDSPSADGNTSSAARIASANSTAQATQAASFVAGHGVLFSHSTNQASSSSSHSAVAKLTGQAGTGAKSAAPGSSETTNSKTGTQADTNQDSQNAAAPTASGSSQSQPAAAVPNQGGITLEQMSGPIQAVVANPVHDTGKADPQQGAAAQGGEAAQSNQSAAASSSAAQVQTQPLINTARLIQSMGQSEMRVGMRSSEFGNISISTSSTRDAITAQIAVDHSDLAKIIAAHLPEVQAKLGGNQTMDIRVDTNGSGASLGTSTSGSMADGSAAGQQGSGRQQSGNSTSSAYGMRGASDSQIVSTVTTGIAARVTPGARLDITV